MTTAMSRYCKAYLVKDLRRMPGWTERTDDLEPLTRELADGDEEEVKRTQLKDDDVLFLHDDFTVTDGIFLREHVVFDTVTEAWKQACREVLAFEVPEYCREDIIVDASDQYTPEELKAMQEQETAFVKT